MAKRNVGGRRKRKGDRGRLRIGDDWNAITIIALSQSNPLKALAELVENSIDAQAREVMIIRGKERGQHFLRVIDDGNGVPCNEEGAPNFRYVATHICDSIKRRLKQEGALHVQGEFGIGLLSFWTIGQRLTMISSGASGKTLAMEMEKGKQGYSILPRPRLVARKGTQITIAPLLSGVRFLNGEKVQRYLASELRDRIRRSGVKIRIVDRIGRAEYFVEPRQFAGRLLHGLPSVVTPFGEGYVELYWAERSPENLVSLFRSGTRVIADIGELEAFRCEPWNCGFFEGIIDAPFLNLTPGTRGGVIHDERFSALVDALRPLAERLTEVVREQVRAEEERMSRNVLRTVQKALREAMLALPSEEYDWFRVHEQKLREGDSAGAHGGTDRDGAAKAVVVEPDSRLESAGDGAQKQFFEYAGPLFSCRISPGSALVPVKEEKSFRAVGLDRKRKQVESELSFAWELADGNGRLSQREGEFVVFGAPEEPGLARLKLTARQGERVCAAEAVITVVASLERIAAQSGPGRKGLPGYTLESAAGEVWRSRFDEARNIVVVNKGHRDYVFASRNSARKVRYICRLFVKELICRNFPGAPREQLLERMVELSMYSEESLR